MDTSNSNERRSMRPRARVVHTLGSELISNENVAISELVKNAYDADATTVTIRFRGPLCQGAGAIEVWDDGHGMSIQTVQGSWLELATPSRRQSPFSESGSRRVLGEKGIGRLAGSRIGHKTTLTTRRYEAPEVRAEVDWDLFEDEAAFLDEVEVSLRWGVSNVFDGSDRTQAILGSRSTHGTLIRMSRLKRDWGRAELSELRNSLSRLVPPALMASPAKPGHNFSINLHLPKEYSELSGKVLPVAAFEHPHYSISGHVAADGRAELTFQDRLRATSEEIILHLKVKGADGTSSFRPPVCGPFDIDIRAWDLDAPAFRALLSVADLGIDSVTDYRNLIRSQSGVAMYRDGFRVQPFGESSYDWLNLDARRVNNPTTRLSNNQVRGFVRVSADENPGLRDRSHREGLIDSPAFEDLKSVVTEVIAELEQRRRVARRDEDASKEERDNARGIFDGFSLEPIRELIRTRPIDPQLNRALESASDEVSAGVKKVQDALSRYSRLATLGSLIDVILHDGRGALSRIKFAIDDMVRARANEDHTPGEFLAMGEKALPRVVVGAEQLGGLFDRIAPLSGRKGVKPKPVRLDALIKKSIELLESEFQRVKVETEIRAEPVTVLVDQAEIFQILVNLYDNAIYWMSRQDSSSERKLLIEAQAAGKAITITVTDSGPGVPVELREAIFDPYFSAKPDGTGLGLAIAGSTVHDLYGGTLELVESKELPGASFRVKVNERTGN